MVFMASFSYSMLYISLLSFGGIMISFLKLVGISEIWLAIGRGFGAAVGVGEQHFFWFLVAEEGPTEGD